jgi:hypothetical protein
MPTPRTEVSTAPAHAHSHAQRVTCHGLSPDPRKQGRQCGRLLAIMPVPLRFIGLAQRAAEAPSGRVYLLCTRKGCHVWNVFEPLEPLGPLPDTAPAA